MVGLNRFFLLFSGWVTAVPNFLVGHSSFLLVAGNNDHDELYGMWTTYRGQYAHYRWVHKDYTLGSHCRDGMLFFSFRLDTDSIISLHLLFLFPLTVLTGTTILPDTEAGVFRLYQAATYDKILHTAEYMEKRNPVLAWM